MQYTQQDKYKVQTAHWIDAFNCVAMTPNRHQDIVSTSWL